MLFAETAGCRPAWIEAPTEWNMIQSQTVLEWMRMGEAKGKGETLLRVLHARFHAVPTDLESTIRAATDLAVLDRWIDAAATRATLADFRQAAGL